MMCFYKKLTHFLVYNYRKLTHLLTMPVYAYCILLGILLLFSVYYWLIEDQKIKEIPFQIFVSLISIVITVCFIDFLTNKKRLDETRAVRRIAFIRASNILCFINDIWSELVELSITEYTGEYIYTEEYYNYVKSNVNLLQHMHARNCKVFEFLYNQSSMLYELIDKYINTYGVYIPASTLAILGRIQWCGILQLGKVMNGLPPLLFPQEFPFSWEMLQKDFKLFEALENDLSSHSWEFPNLREEDLFDPPSLHCPSFKGHLRGKKLKSD